MKSDAEREASPMKSLLEELDGFRGTLHSTLDGYRAKLEGDLDAIREKLVATGDSDKVAAAKMRDIRDMLTLLRHIEVKPEKGRRKDLKKLDSVVGDLILIIENW